MLRATYLNYEIAVHVEVGRGLELVLLAGRVLETVGCLKMLLAELLLLRLLLLEPAGRQTPRAAPAG